VALGDAIDVVAELVLFNLLIILWDQICDEVPGHVYLLLEREQGVALEQVQLSYIRILSIVLVNKFLKCLAIG